MGDKKSTEKNIRKITKVGGTSYAITIPIEMMRELGWRERQRVVVEKKGDRITIKDWEKK